MYYTDLFDICVKIKVLTGHQFWASELITFNLANCLHLAVGKHSPSVLQVSRIYLCFLLIFGSPAQALQNNLKAPPVMLWFRWILACERAVFCMWKNEHTRSNWIWLILLYISNRPAHRSPNSEHDKLLTKSLQFQNCARLAGFCGESPSPTDEFERWVTIFCILVHWLQFKRGERFLAQKYHRSSAIVTAIIWKECCHDIWPQTPQNLCLCCSPNFISKFTTKVVAFNVVYR